MENWGWLEPHPADGDLWRRQFGGDFNNDGQPDGFRGFRNQQNSTSALIEELRFSAAKSIRTSTIILSVFNVIAAFATAVGILWDGYAGAKKNDPKFKFRTSGFSFIGAAETFPLVLSCGILIQGIVFAVAQSTGLEGLLVLGCTITSQMMLPAVFIVPFIQLIFGLEVTIRAVRRQPFMPRGKWTVAVCIAIIGSLLLITYIITHFIRPPNLCFASLFWFVQMYKEGCFALLLIVAVVLMGSAVLVFLKLHRNAKIDSTERVAASRMVYFMAVAVISATLMLPFFFTISFYDRRGRGNTGLQLSMVAAVVANVSGLMTGGLHLFFRSNSVTTIGPKHEDVKCTEIERQNFKRGIRLWSPRETDDDNSFGSHVTSPIHHMTSNDTVIDREEVSEKAYESGNNRMNPLRSNAVFPSTVASDLKAPEPVMANTQHARKGSYSLFPAGSTSTKSVGVLPATTYDPETKEMMLDEGLKPPAPVTTRHRRDSSMASHATVQIGLRFSNVEDMPPIDSKYLDDSHKVHNLDCPNAAFKTISPAKRPSPLSNVHMDQHDDDDVSEYDEDEDTMVNSDRKTLPSPPGEHDGKDCTLSPTVYKPASPTKATRMTTSPRDMGFTNLSSPRNAPAQQPPQGDWV